MVQAITVSDGEWRIERCVIQSSRRASRACSGIVLKDKATVHLISSLISTCTQGVLVHAPSAVFTASDCRLENHRDGIVARWGKIHVMDTHLNGCSTPIKLESDAWGESTFERCHTNGVPFSAANGELETLGGANGEPPELAGF